MSGNDTFEFPDAVYAFLLQKTSHEVDSSFV
jgi:hypothetical protein